MTSHLCQTIVIVITILSIIVSFILSGFIRQQLFYFGAQFTYDFQHPTSSAGQIIFNIIQLPGKAYVLGPILGIVFLISYRKFNAIIFIMYMGLCIFLIPFTKQIFQDPRPFWVIDSITQLQWGCSTQYGFPSGHAWISVLLFEPILSDFIGGQSKWKYITLIFTGSLIPLSRIYLGVHSVDQILIGLLLSLAMVVLYRYKIQELLYLYLEKCLKSKKISKILCFTIIANIVFLVCPIILFQINTKSRVLESDVLQSVNKICETQYSIQEIQQKISMQQTYIFGVFGFIYGVILASKFGLLDNWLRYYSGYWQYGSIKNLALKLLLYIVIVGITGGIIAVLIPMFIDNFYGSLFITLIGLTMAGTSLTFFIPFIAIKFQIINFIQIQKLSEVQSETGD